TKRTGAIPWQGYPGDRHWLHSWGQVRLVFSNCAENQTISPSGGLPEPHSPPICTHGTLPTL
ncbi:MAG: hypothetical protein WCJ21_06905, partial [Planctomycetota bacterium]